MATNESIAYYLERSPVDPTEECVSTGSEILDLVVRKVYVAGLASTVAGGGVTPSTNNQVAALQARIDALTEQVNDVEGRIPDRRVAAKNLKLPTGDSTQILSWTPPFDTTDYEVRITLEGASTHPGAAALYAWRVIYGTKTTTSVQVSFDNQSENTYITAVIETL